jgi:hypothetical protein
MKTFKEWHDIKDGNRILKEEDPRETAYKELQKAMDRINQERGQEAFDHSTADFAYNISPEIGKILGFAAGGLVALWVTSLILLLFSKGLKNIWGNIKRAGENMGFTGDKIEKIKSKILSKKESPQVKKEMTEIIDDESDYEDLLERVYMAIKAGNYQKAHEEYMNIPSQERNIPEVTRAIITRVSRREGNIPINKPSPGNKTYQGIKTICGMKIAKAAAVATEFTLGKLAGKSK